MDALLFLIFFHTGSKIAAQLIQCEMHYLQKFLKHTPRANLGMFGVGGPRSITCFPTHLGSSMGRIKATGGCEEQIDPLIPKIPLFHKTQPRLGQNPIFPFSG